MNNPTKDEILAMAREAGMSVYTLTPVGGDWIARINPDQLERFATLCRAPLVAENAALNADMKQMGTDLSAIQEIHNQQKAKLYAELADWKARALKAEQT